MSRLSQSIAAHPSPQPTSSMVRASPTRPDTTALSTRFVVTTNRVRLAPVLSPSGTFELVPEDEPASRKPSPVMGSGDSWTTRGFGKDVSAVGLVVRFWSRCRYSKTVPSPSPTARCDRLLVKAIEVTCSSASISVHSQLLAMARREPCCILTSRSSTGPPPLAFFSSRVKSHIFKTGNPFSSSPTPTSRPPASVSVIARPF